MTTPKKTTGVRVPIYLDEELTKLASYRDITKNSLIVTALWEYLKKEKGNNND